MTEVRRPGPGEAPEDITRLALVNQFEVMKYWLVLPTHAGSTMDPKILKTEPRGLGAGEVALVLHIRVPKTRTRIAQTLEITMPDEASHVSKIEIMVPEQLKA